MAIGTLKGTLVGNANSIPNPAVLSGSVSVAVGDLVYGVIGQQTNLTATDTISDNLGNSYSFQNAGTDPGSPTARPFYGRITVAGTLTTINVPTTSSTNDWAGAAEVIEGPVIVSPLDANPSNITSDTTSPFTCPATGTMAQPFEIVCCWGAANQSTVWAATSPNLLGENRNNSTNVKVAIGYQLVTATTTISPAFTAAANPTTCILGTASFKCLVQQTDGAVSAQSATAAGTGASSSETTDGAVSAQSASASGAALSESIANGSPDAASATVAGVGLVEDAVISGSGALSAGSATASGSAQSSSTASGALVCSSSDAEGSGLSATFALGSLFASAASVTGAGASESFASGACDASAAQVSGAGFVGTPPAGGAGRYSSMLIAIGIRIN